jgi:hypothetical protein
VVDREHLSDWLAERVAAARREGADAALAPVEALVELWDRKARELHSTAHDAGDMAAEWDADAHEHHARALRAVIAHGWDAAKGGS